MILTERKRAQTVAELSVELDIPQLRELIQRFLFQMVNPEDPRDLINVPLHECPIYDGRVKVFNAASATFFAPSDISGVGGMRRVVRICAFFSFKTQDGEDYPCAVVRWFILSDEPDEDTGMWIVRPGYNARHQPDISVVHINTIHRAAHLIPVYGAQEIPSEIGPHHSYDVFRAYYVNKYADHHAFEIAS